MRVPKATDYAVRALMDLAERYGQGSIQSAEIAARQAIPESFLDQLLGTLRKAGLVNTTRGRQGGHTLAVPPDRISLADVAQATEGPVTPMECATAPGDCAQSAACALRDAWQEAEQARQQVLGSISIGDLLRRQQERSAIPMYYI